jgi:pleiotropic regulator 1
MATSSSPETLLQTSRQRTKAIFGDIHLSSIEANEQISHRARLASKIRSDYQHSRELPAFLAQKHGRTKKAVAAAAGEQTNGVKQIKMIEDAQYVSWFIIWRANLISRNQPSNALTVRTNASQSHGAGAASSGPRAPSSSLVRRENYQPVKPEWHAPWKLRTVLRCVVLSICV